MREFKKYFFETLIQLTILASVFRQNSDDSLNRHLHHTTTADQYIDQLTNNYHYHYSPVRNASLVGDLDLLLLNENSNYLRYQANLNSNSSSSSSGSNYSSSGGIGGSDLVHRNHLLKEQDNRNDLKLIQRFNRLLSSSSSSSSSSRRFIKPPIDPIANHQILFPNNLFVAPATFQSTNNNHKELQFELSEAENRLLLDLNANNYLNSFSKEDKDIFEMEVDIQKIIEQDIDIGITKDCYQYFDSSNNAADPYFDPNDGITWKKGGQDLAKTLAEKQKDTDLISLTTIFEQQYVPEGYRLVVEEDTGEWILTVLPSDNSTGNFATTAAATSSEPINQTSTARFFNTTSSPKPRRLVNHSKSINEEELDPESEEDSNSFFNIKVKFSIFDEKHSLHANVANEVQESMSRHALREADLRRLSSSSGESQSPSEIKPMHLDADLLRQTSVDPEMLSMFDDANLLNDFQFNSTSSQLVSFEPSPSEPAVAANPQDGNNFFSTQPAFSTDYSQAQQQQQQQLNSSLPAYHPASFEDNSLANGLKANVSMQQPQDMNMTINCDFLASFESNLQNIASPLVDQQYDSDQSESNIDFNLESFDAFLEQEIMNSGKNDFQSQRQSSSSNDLANSHDGFDINEIFKMIEETTNNFNISNELNPKSRVASGISTSSLLTTSLNNDAVHHDEAKTVPESLTLKQEATEPEDDTKPPSIIAAFNRTAIVRGVEHNHTYLFGSSSGQDENNAAESFRMLHPYSYKNKLKKTRNMSNSMEQSNLNQRQQQSRDELLLRENQVYISLDQIVNTDADQFNELMRIHALSVEQMNIVKDIRRRGKNKVAAQICRKRKIDSIDSLREDVGELREEKKLLQSEYLSIEAQIKKMTMKFDELYKDLMGNEYDKNDPIMICMTNLKDQLNLNNQKPIAGGTAASTLNNSLSEEEEEDELDDFEEDDEEEDEDDELDDEEEDEEYGSSNAYAGAKAAATTSAAKKPLAKALSNNRRTVSKPLNPPSVLSPPTTDASNSSLSAYEPASAQASSKAKRFKKN